jgi:[protein-PII] uridylyltransferase
MSSKCVASAQLVAPPDLARFRGAIAALGTTQAKQFDDGIGAEILVRERAERMDELLRDAWAQFGLDNVRDLSLVAVGGYGRGELHPASDIDVLILGTVTALETPKLPDFLTFLWDSGLDLGHAVRTIEDCVEQARADITIATNLLEARPVAGPVEMVDAMRSATSQRSIWPSRAFFEAKREEQRNRHHRYHDTAYNLEPNVKGGPGGLRDLQMIGWVAKRHFGADTLKELVSHKFLTEDEYARLIECQHFLWQVRFALHIVTGRREDRLLFDHQREVARRFGHESSHRNEAIEQFMQRYYRTIRALSRLNEMLLELFEEVLLHDDQPAKIESLNRRFQLRNGFLEVCDEGVFAHYSFALLEMFLMLQLHPEIKGVRATTIRLVREHLHQIDDNFRADLRARSLFMEIMRQPRGITHELQRMHDYGVLAAYIPAFGNVTGRMQYDLFHAYTVDQHTLFVVRNLRCFFVPERFHEFPRCSAIVDRLPKPELLYLGGLFHDIAKGREGDHSKVGSDDAREFCLQHGMGQFDADVVAWLVRNHLLMSVTAQRKDTSDPQVLNEFAEKVGDRMHLDYLYLLTVADIRATNPKLWNDWKDSLLWSLYQSTVRLLRKGARQPVNTADIARDTQSGARRLLGQSVNTTRLRNLWRPFVEDYFVRSNADELAWHASAILSAGIEELPLVALREGRGGIELFIYAPDKNDLFAALTAALDRLGLNILDARIITADSGMTLDSFVLAQTHGEAGVDAEREREIYSRVKEVLRRTGRSMPTSARMPRRQLKNFHIDTTVSFAEDPSGKRTIMEVITQDRPGLLARVGWALAACQVSLQSAKIATFGERAEDLFYVRDRTSGPLSAQQQACLTERIQRALQPRER